MLKLALLIVVLWVVFKLGRYGRSRRTRQDIATKIMLAMIIVLLFLAVVTNLQK
ncbi:MAG: hypothetical protein PWQ57_643 [Desulfovibrionales bacterium]|jgi:hypothetical protein|nr:hypothetical protein [Desulfovibrionales bacterium]